MAGNSLSLVWDLIARDGASPAFTRVSAAADKAAASTEAASVKTAASLSKMAAVGAAAGLAFAVGATKMASDFQKQMLLIQTQAGASADEVRKMGPAILSLSGKVAQAPEALATSLYHVESTGLRGKAALEAVKIAAEGAAVGHADLEETTNALTATIASGMLPATESYSQAMGQLNTIVGSGDMKMSDLNEALASGLLVTTKQYGVTLNDVGAALADFGDNNIRGADAATALRMAVQSIAKPGVGAVGALKSIGLTVQQLQSDEQTGGLNKALTDLHTHLVNSGIDASKWGELLTTAFTKKAGTGILTLIGTFDRFEQKYKEVSGGADSFGNAWAATTKTAAFQANALKDNFDAMAISVGQHLLPAATTAMTWINQNAVPAIEHLGSGVLAAAHWFGELPTPIKDTALALGALAVANKVGIFGALESGAGKLVSTLGSLASGAKGTVTSLSGLKAAGTGLMNFFGGPVVLGIAGVTAAFVASSQEIDDWAKGLEQGGKAAFDATQQLEAAHTRSIASAHSVGDAWGIVKGAFADGLAQIEGYSSAQDKATQKAQDWYNALSPTQKLTQNVTVDQNDLNLALDAYGRGSDEAKFAAWRLNLALGDQQTAQAETDIAIRGTNGALQSQIGLQQQLSKSGLDLDQATLTSKQAIDQYKSSLKDANLTEDARAQALDGVSQAMFGVLDAAKQKADAETKGLPASITTNQEIVRQRDALDAVVQQLGFVPPALQGMYDQLNGPTAKALQAAQTNVNNMGTAMTTVTDTSAPALQKALGDLATAAGTTFPLAVTGGFLPAAKGAGDAAVITAGHVGQAQSNVDGLVRSLLGVPSGTDVTNKALAGSNGWFGTVAGAVSNLTNWIKGIPAVNIQADATQANNTIDAFLQKVQSQGFVGAIWNIHPVGGGGGGGVPGLPPIPGRAGGGIIPGPRSSVRDNVLGLSSSGVPTARVEPGEFIVNAAQTSRNRVLLEGINAGLVGLAGGGYVLPRSLTYPVDAGQGLMALVQKEAQSALSSTFTGGGGGGAGSPFIRLLGASIAASMGFGGQFNAIDYIFSRESGWNPTAQNPSSSAYGIPQFLNGTWAAYGGKTSDAAQQIRDGISYMRDRYGSPNAAAAFWQAHHWYKNGTNYVPSDQLALLHKGEAVVPASQNQGAPYVAGGPQVNFNYNGPVVTQDIDEMARQNAQRTRRVLSSYAVRG